MTQDHDAASSALREPLEELARFAFDAAPRLCRPDHGCAPYHRAWSMIRLLTKGGALPGGLDYFAPRLKQAARDGHCRVLLSGAADTGLAAMVLEASRQVGVAAQIVLADRCATTLEQNRRYAERLGQRFELHQTDLAALNCDPVDVVLTHSVLHFSPPQARGDIIRSWARILRPGGVLTGLQRFGAGGIARDPESAAESAALLETAALAYGFDPAFAAEVRGAGMDFWSKRHTYPAMEASAFRQLLLDTGFEVLDLAALAAPVTASPANLLGRGRMHPQHMFTARKAGPGQAAA